MKIKLQGNAHDVEAITYALRQWLQILDDAERHDQSDAGIVKRYLTVARVDQVTGIDGSVDCSVNMQTN
ncbi:MAG: hypothetical protein NZ772_14255 [Cyanobacteria bacterium]|nr:hypothetical protein [Cyanobacteriota bacterium]